MFGFDWTELVRMLDLTSIETVWNFSRTECAICRLSWTRCQQGPQSVKSLVGIPEADQIGNRRPAAWLAAGSRASGSKSLWPLTHFCCSRHRC